MDIKSNSFVGLHKGDYKVGDRFEFRPLQTLHNELNRIRTGYNEIYLKKLVIGYCPMGKIERMFSIKAARRILKLAKL
jgi:hypothetical protein